MSEEKKETWPVRIRLFLPNKEGKEYCIFNRVIETSQSKYYFSAEDIKRDAIKALIEELRTEIVLFFPAKDEIP